MPTIFLLEEMHFTAPHRRKINSHHRLTQHVYFTPDHNKTICAIKRLEPNKG